MNKWICFLGICLFILSGCRQGSKEDKIPVLIFTDFGRDVDDAEAFAYLAMNPNIELAGVVCNSYIPENRAHSLSLFLQLFNKKNTHCRRCRFSLENSSKAYTTLRLPERAYT